MRVTERKLVIAAISIPQAIFLAPTGRSQDNYNTSQKKAISTNKSAQEPNVENLKYSSCY